MNKKLALVTGGSRGIGKKIVEKLASEGFSVAFTFCNSSKLAEKLSNDCKALGYDVSGFYLNQDSSESIKACLDKIKIKFKRYISILVNNAAISQEKDFSEITSLDWEIMLKTNLQGPFILIQNIVPEMIAKNYGKIVNITSIGGQWGGFNQVHYAASKAGLISLTMSVGKIYSNKGINCNSIAVGLVQTDMTLNELESNSGKLKIKNIPIGRIGKTEDVANTVSYLISDDASYITGQTINLNGGMYFG